MKQKNYLLSFFFFLTIFISGCSTVEPANHYGNKPLESFKSAYVVFAKNTTIGGYIAADLARRNIKVSLGALKDKPKEVAFYVIYTDHWNWDVAVYLDSLDVQFIDNSNGQIIASGSFKNSKLLESWPDPRKKTFEVIDSIYNAK
jgi:hypothetical protein